MFCLPCSLFRPNAARGWIAASFAAAATLAPTALAQGTVTETRVIDSVDDVSAPGGPNVDVFVGLEGPTSYLHGEAVRVEMGFDLTFDVDVTITNPSNAPRNYEVRGLLDLQYLSDGDLCAQYAGTMVAIDLGTVAPGATQTVTQVETYSLAWSGTDFDGFCSVDWEWDEAFIVESPGFPVRFEINGSPNAEGITTNRMDLRVDGQYEAEWIPNEFVHLSICPGNYGQPAPLTPGGAAGNVWLTQFGLPNTWGLLVRSDTALPGVPATGLCVGQGGSTIVRLNDSISIGGEAYRFGDAAAFSGVLQHFQSVFRLPTGGFRTGECIGVVLP